MHRAALVPLALLLAGGVLIGDAVVRGEASVAIVVVVPVAFGSSAEFLLGVVLLLVGFVTLPLAFMDSEWSVASGGPGGRTEVPTAEVGGLILIGPVPVFFGGWKTVPLRTKLAVAVLGAGLLVLLAVVLFLR
jgi:uncharacterized membrane protein